MNGPPMVEASKLVLDLGSQQRPYQATTTLFTTRPCNVLITHLVFIVFRAPGNIV